MSCNHVKNKINKSIILCKVLTGELSPAFDNGYADQNKLCITNCNLNFVLIFFTGTKATVAHMM